MCRHEWVIETAEGPTSWGECRLCHETKEFENGTPAAPSWGHSKNVPQIQKDAEELAQSADEDNAEMELAS